jgi:hypothetical protein
MPEQVRGCGWRKVGGAYLVGSGLSASCDALPLELVPCSLCEFEIPFSRGIQEIHIGYLAGRMKGHVCSDKFLGCPLCYYAKEKKISKFYLMFVSSKYYSPASFIKEAQRQGVSKRIAPQSLPKDFKIGESWIFLAHNKVPMKPLEPLDIQKWKDNVKRAIFYAFKPSRIEIVLWKDADPRTIAEWKKKGFTPILIDKNKENIRRHGKPGEERLNVRS